MSKFYFISPIDRESPDLFQTFTKTFVEQGHEIVTDVFQADVAFIDLFSNVSKEYPSSFAYAINKAIPLVYFDEVDYGGMSKERFNPDPMITHLPHKSICFMRKMDKTIQYPEWVFPYEKIIQNDFPITTIEELCSRPYDFCFIGNTSPQRQSTVKGLLDAGLMGIVRWTNEEGKIPHEEWLGMHRKAKMFLSADGGGFSCERPYQLISVSVFLRQKNNHLQTHPFSDCINCLEVSENPTEEEVKGIKAVLDDPEYLFEIYEEGAKFAREYYSQEFRANYILDTLKKEGVI